MVADRSHLGLELAARYRIEEILAAGSVCRVYRGADIILRRQVAIKVVPAQAVPAYRRALVLTAQLTHPAIIATFDAIERDGELFLVQEYVQTRPFRTYLRNGLPIERAADLAGQIARALAYAHAHGIVHGDLTPAALLVDRRAALRVNNFCLPPDETYFAEASATIEGGLGATQTPDAAGDVRAVGLLLWQALTSEQPTGSGPDGRGDRAFRPEVPESARTLVRRCLAAEDGAIRDAETLVLALEELGRELSAARPAVSEDTPPALRVAREMIAHEAPWSLGDTLGVAVSAWADEPARATQPSGIDPSAATVPAGQSGLPSGGRGGRATAGPARLALPSRPMAGGTQSGAPRRLPYTAPPVWAAPKEQRPSTLPAQAGGISLALVLAAGVVLFLLFFIIGITVRP